MSDWKFLNQHRAHVAGPTVPPMYVSDESFGFNGLFRFTVDGHNVRCIASDGMGWQHVSVSLEYERKMASWPMMCKIKELFWEPEDWVMQFHPAKSEYVNFHPYCLHLWRPTEEKFPVPLAIMVGPLGMRGQPI